MTPPARVLACLVLWLPACRDAAEPAAPTPTAKAETVATPAKTDETKTAEPKAAEAKSAAPKPAEMPVSPPPNGDVDLGLVLALDSPENRGVQWTRIRDGHYESVGEPARRLTFAMHSFTRAGTPHRLALWGFDDEADEVNAALLAGAGAAWTPVWTKRPFVEDPEAPDEVGLPWAIPLGPEGLLVVHSPSIVGCGSEDCPEEDDYVDNLFFEITPAGPVEVLTLRAMGCTREEDRHPVAPAQCLVRTEANAAAPAPDLVVTLTGKKPRTLRFAYRDGKYAKTK